MKHFIRYIYLLFLFPFSLFAHANYWGIDENTIIKQIGENEGLSNLRVFSVEKDDKNFVWFSTRTGVDRYDGKSMRHYNLYHSNIIPDENGRVYKLYTDRWKRVWCFTNSGKIFIYNPISDSFELKYNIWNITKDKSVQTNAIWLDADSTCWVALSNSILSILPTKKVVRYPLNGAANNFISYKNSFIVLTDNGLIALNKKIIQKDNNKVLSNAARINNTPMFVPIITGIQATSALYDEIKDEFWVGTFSQGLKLYYNNGQQYTPIQLTLNLPQQPYLSIERLNNFLICVGIDGGGLALINADKRQVENRITENLDAEKGLRGNGVYDVFIEDSRYIWVATYTGGVTLIDAYINRFKVDLKHNEKTVPNNHINAICEDADGDIWYATNRGVVVHLKNENKWLSFLENEGVFLSLCRDEKSKNMWVGGFGAGLTLLNKNKGKIVQYKKESRVGLTTNFVYAIYVKDNSIWVGGLDGNLVCLSLPISKRRGTEYPVKHVNSISLTPNGEIAVATGNGFCIIDAAEHLNWYAKDVDIHGESFNSFIYCCYFESDTVAWLGTDGAGLCRYSLNKKATTLFTTTDGMPSNYVYAIEADSRGILWISTDNGLVNLHLGENTINRYSASDGLSISHFNFNSSTKLSNGELCFGARNGVLTFNPLLVSKAVLKKGLQFWDFKLSYRSVLPGQPNSPLKKPISDIQSIFLSHNQNTFSFSFGVIDFWSSNEYRYQLKGYDDIWVYAGTSNTANYTQVPPGKYTFVVEHLSNALKGSKPLESRSIDITIEKAYWDRWWAWIIYTFIVALFIYRLWRMREDRILAKYSEEKTRFFVHAAHDLRTPVTLIKAPLVELSNEHLSENGALALKMAIKSSERLSQMVGQLLDFQQTDLHAMRICFTTTQLVDFVADRLEPFNSWCKQKNITLDVDLPNEPLSAVIDRMLLGKIIDNLLSNAVKYTPMGGHIGVVLEKDSASFLFKVTDTGIGIPQKARRAIFTHFFRAGNAYDTQAEGSGIGLMLTKRYVELHKGKISFHSVEGEGSTFQFIIPLTLTPSSEKDITQYNVNKVVRTETSDELIYSDQNHLHTKLLFVEDNDDLRIYMLRVLSNRFQIIACESADVAVQYLQNKSVDIIVSDVMMPGMQGDEFCSWVKGNMSTSHIPFILLSARSSKTDILDGLKRGADDYLPKPFDLDILIGRIDNLLESRKRMKQKYMKIIVAKPNKASIPNIEEENIEPFLNAEGRLEEDFLQKINALIMKNIKDSDYQTDSLCRDMAMSRSVLYGKLKVLTGDSPSAFIRLRRISYAQVLLEESGCTVQEAAEESGFTDVKNFSTLFKKITGISPGKVKTLLKK